MVGAERRCVGRGAHIEGRVEWAGRSRWRKSERATSHGLRSLSLALLSLDRLNLSQKISLILLSLNSLYLQKRR